MGVCVDVGRFWLNVLVPVNALFQFVMAIFVSATAHVFGVHPFNDTLDTHVSSESIASYTPQDVMRFVLSSVTSVSVGRFNVALLV